MHATAVRVDAIVFLLLVLLLIWLACRFLAPRSPRPAVLWAATGYWTFLHLICVYGLLTSTRFESALAPLTLFTFPVSLGLGDLIYTQGFETPAGLAANYVRYVVCFGGLNALLIAAFLTLVVPGRLPALRRENR